MELFVVAAALVAGFVLGWQARFSWQAHRVRRWKDRHPERFRRFLDALRQSSGGAP